MNILCKKCNRFLVTDGKTLVVINHDVAFRGNRYYCEECDCEVVADFGKGDDRPAALTAYREGCGHSGLIDLDMGFR